MKYRLLPTVTSCVVTLVLLVATTSLTAFRAHDTSSIEPEPRHSCSSLSLDNGGYAVFGYNKDHTFVDGLVAVNKRYVAKSGWEPSTGGEYAVWTSKYGSVTFNHSGYQLPSAGMNEAGLMISTHALLTTENPAPDARPPIVSALWAQYVLDNFSTVEEVLASDSRVRISETEDHYLVCDRTGDCATIEFLGGEMVYHTGDALPVKALTNSTYEDSLEAWQESAIHPQADVNSLTRFFIVADRVAAFETSSVGAAVEYAFETLAEASQEATRGSVTTAWTIVFDTENMRVHFRTHMNPEIRTIDFSKLDFSCSSPAQILDVHAELSGDISDQLPVYSHGANLDHVFASLEAFDIDLPQILVRALVRGMESSPCMETADALPYPGGGKSLLPPIFIWLALDVLQRLLLIWIPLVLGSLAFLTWDLTSGTQASWSTRALWGFVVVVLGPFGLLVYLLSYRKRWRDPAAVGGST